MPRIVVGVDGSPESRAALRWAVAEARLRGARLEAVHVWSFPIVPGRELGPSYVIPIEELREDAKETLDLVLAEEGVEGVNVERAVVEGNPADVLVEAAREADLLVVGSRGHGGVAGLLLGSVSRQCAHHAACPVVIVRRGAER
jgi:nucleotide-binding universal stress UspA family protein